MEQVKSKIFTNRFFVAVVALFCCALWGSATPFIKIGYELILPAKDVASTILFAGVRFTLAGVFTVLIYSIGRKKFLLPKKENLGKVATVSCFQTILQYIFFYIGLANTTGVKGTVESGSSAFFALLISSLIFTVSTIVRHLFRQIVRTDNNKIRVELAKRRCSKIFACRTCGFIFRIAILV